MDVGRLCRESKMNFFLNFFFNCVGHGVVNLTKVTEANLTCSLFQPCKHFARCTFFYLTESHVF